MSKLDQLIEEIQNELGSDFYYMGIVGSDGLLITMKSRVDRNYDTIAARMSMLHKLATKVSDKLNLGEVEDNLITANTAYAISQLLGDGSYFAFVGLSKDATLGVARMVLKEYADQLWDAIPR